MMLATSESQQSFLVKGQIVSVLDFAGIDNLIYKTEIETQR